MFNEKLSLYNQRLETRGRPKIRPGILHQPMNEECEIQILIVTGDSLYFNDENVDLNNFISILETTSLPSTKLIVSKAHRKDPGTERLNGANKNYRFTSNSLANIDVIFMFTAGQDLSLLSTDELKVLAKFMDEGGDVFTTDDHDWLGLAMCGDLIHTPRYA
jgi:hypothetical protein